ncbi:hypothetical protein UFOVP328_255 [uncultured Caudovirales phage]|uniref:Uncharacterized protein n=1 Tax=uncultured Caudovirales phage TaxID=2100421 RepID=A0A6J5LW58_9CAUD|nr:hypothetical protein UFOVP328_255 [uncultured Caudovirales phage]
MTIAFVIGNGVSRQSVDLTLLKPLGKIYGCNALYRDFVPDVLIATDRPIAEHIQKSGYPIENKFYTRKPLEGLGAHQVPKPYYGFSSGPLATGIAAQDQHSKIYIIGFDMGPVNNRFNNVYADTDFYRKSDATPVYTGNWIKQIRKITEDYPKTHFVRVQGLTTAYIKEFDTVGNLSHLPMSTFVDRINNQKDL